VRATLSTGVAITSTPTWQHSLCLKIFSIRMLQWS